jgi:N-acetylmuramic acid 6-phosphate etherase
LVNTTLSESEKPHSRAGDFDRLDTLAFLEVMNDADAAVAPAVRLALPAIAAAIEAIAPRLAAGGHLHYFGAGTSGQLAALDAMECPNTFGVAPNLVVAHTCSGADEDDQEAGRRAASGVTAADAAVGVSASGETLFTVGALRAVPAGALRVSLTCVPGSALAAAAEITIETPTGREVVAGSTRLKAGTAQKLVLNMLSTGTFARLGYVYRGRMVGVALENAKLRARAAGIVEELGDVSRAKAEQALEAAGGDVRVALVMLRSRSGAHAARERLAAAGWRLHAVLNGVEPGPG